MCIRDRHCRYFLRCISKYVWLYTEMIHAHAIIKGRTERLLAYDPKEHPLALQLGGSEPEALAEAAKIGECFGYDEINLNVGCPSPRVSAGRFGACLMAEPDLVADCIAAMCAVVSVPVTVKTRIGIDEQDSFEALCELIEKVSLAGCQHFIIHARKAWLQGLSPKDNRIIPPLRYDVVYQLTQVFPHLRFILNGGLTTHDDIASVLTKVDGVMLGRAAYHDPYLLAHCDSLYLTDDFNDVRFQQRDCIGEAGSLQAVTRYEIVEAMLPYIEAHLSRGGRLAEVTRHMLGLFHGQQHGKIWRRILSENAHKPGANSEVVRLALSAVR